MMRLFRSFAVCLFAGLLSSNLFADEPNRLRNGSFEGHLLYWHNVDPEKHTLVRGDATTGEFALRLDGGYVMSAPVVCEAGEPITVSFDVKAEREGTVRVQIPPSAREPGQRAKRLWSAEGTQTKPVGTEWQRVTFTAPADVPQDGFWRLPHYLVQIAGSVPILIDGVTVQTGTETGTERYLARTPIEIVHECVNLPRYPDGGRLFAKGADAELIAHVSNPTDRPRTVTVRQQLIDYEGRKPVGEPLETRVTLKPGQTTTLRNSLPLNATGCVLARASVIDEDTGEPIDQSDQPLTSLPYPVPETRKPDLRERFGGSYFETADARNAARLGMSWSRWHPHTKWHDHQPEGPDSWVWFDKELDELEALGISSHLVLYGWPKWIMEGHGKHPLPKDMRWPADDPSWEDLTIETAWDRYIKECVKHYRGRSVVFEIENEPELDGWRKFSAPYVQFTRRTARLIKATDPEAIVMVNNVYGIPSGINRELLESGAGKWIDIISWHDYRAGELADAASIRRMRANLDRLGCEHIEIWFNEGWAYTNTAVDEPIACTGLTSAESTNAMVRSVAEVTVAGQEKTIIFHTGYPKHGMSFWDYSGPGTMLWDWYDNPLPLAAAWNSLNHHIGLSDRVAFVRPPRANFCIFENNRVGSGVMVAYADGSVTDDVTIELPWDDLIVEDIMGNARPLGSHQLVLSKTGRPVFLYAKDGRSGAEFAKDLEPLDRRHAGFVTNASDGETSGTVYQLPAAWNGESGDENPITANGEPIWRLDQLWPVDISDADHLRPLVWREGWWRPIGDGFGDQPKAERRDTGIRLEARAAHGSPRAERIAGLTFIAPSDGRYTIVGAATHRMWEGNNSAALSVLHHPTDQPGLVERYRIALTKGTTPLPGLSLDMKRGETVTLLPRVSGSFAGGEVTLTDLRVIEGQVPTGDVAETYRLPLSWEGEKVETTLGNPITANGKPIWRFEELWPTDPNLTENYGAMIWGGAAWVSNGHSFGGQPSGSINNGTVSFALRGPWGGAGQGRERSAALTFLPPAAGRYRISGFASSKPWEGKAKSASLGFRKRDTQRAVPLTERKLPRNGDLVPFAVEVDLTEGHELVILPRITDWNNASTVTLKNLRIGRLKP